VGLFLLRGGALHGRWRALGKGEHTTLLSFARGWGALEERGTPSLVGGTLERRELLQGQGKGKARFKDQEKARPKQRHKEKGQRQVKEEGCTKAKGVLLQEASREVFKELQGTPRHPRRVAIVTSSLVYVFRVVHFALRPSIYIYSKPVFPMGGVSKVMLTKNMCQFHACLEV
jgi:hypothetical protein